MIRSELLTRLTQLAPDTTVYAAHVAALAEALVPAALSRQAQSPVGTIAPGLDELRLAELTGTTPELLEAWRVDDEKQTVAPDGIPVKYRLEAVLAWLRHATAHDVDAEERLATAFPMFDYADGAVEDLVGSLSRAHPPSGFWLARIAKAIGDDDTPGNRQFLDMLALDPDTAMQALAGMSDKNQASLNPANWLMWLLCRPAERPADMARVADALALLNDYDIGLGINAYGAADIVRHGLHTRTSFTISHVIAGLTQADRVLAGSLSGYATLVTTLIKLGADFSLQDERGRHVLDVATQVRKEYVSSPFLNIIDKFLLVQQLDEILLHGDDENAEKI